jgi:hypothetical protein
MTEHHRIPPTTLPTLRSLSQAERREWIRQRYPDGPDFYWWLALNEDIGIEALKLLRRGESAREVFKFAVEFLELGRTMGLSALEEAYWLIRFTSLARRFNVPADELPSKLTPDEAARAALAAMPLDPERAATLDATYHREWEMGIERQPDAESEALADTFRLESTFRWIEEAVTDPEVKAQILRWRNNFT